MQHRPARLAVLQAPAVDLDAVEQQLDVLGHQRARQVVARPASQPMRRSWSNCDSVSMPSAITDLPSEAPSVTMARTTSAS